MCEPHLHRAQVRVARATPVHVHLLFASSSLALISWSHTCAIIAITSFQRSPYEPYSGYRSRRVNATCLLRVNLQRFPYEPYSGYRSHRVYATCLLRVNLQRSPYEPLFRLTQPSI